MVEMEWGCGGDGREMEVVPAVESRWRWIVERRLMEMKRGEKVEMEEGGG